MAQTRQTKQKEELSNAVNGLKTFFSAEAVWEQLRDSGSTIGIATVYRFLKDEVHKGNLHSYQCDRRTIYSKQKQHCHYTCQETGEVSHFEVDSLDFLKDKIPGSIVSFQLEVVGTCRKCE